MSLVTIYIQLPSNYDAVFFKLKLFLTKGEEKKKTHKKILDDGMKF